MNNRLSNKNYIAIMEELNDKSRASIIIQINLTDIKSWTTVAMAPLLFRRMLGNGLNALGWEI